MDAIELLECSECEGRGSNEECPRFRNEAEADMWQGRPCDECNGKGRVSCWDCGDMDAYTFVDGQPLCIVCEAGRENDMREAA